MLDDTIAAISTPLGEGAIGIVRISGPQAIAIAETVFVPAVNKFWQKQTYKLVYGHVFDQTTGKIIDEVLLGNMPGPYSYTGEDVVEINCHGGPAPLRKTLELICRAGARPAEAGEFSKRAFLNGRLDLTRAEAVIDMIRAATEDALQLAVNQLSGRLSRAIDDILNELLAIVALVEAAIDFPEDEVEDYSPAQMAIRLTAVIAKVRELIAGAEIGKVYREGIKTVIVGKPNVGKSSLLNVLLREKRAIVTAVPGTTRDIIEEVLNLGGLPVVLIDTAGIRDAGDEVEKLGVARTLAMIDQAGLVLMVADAWAGLDAGDEEIIALLQNKRGILVLNKIDLLQDGLGQVKNELAQKLPAWPVVEISALQEQGIKELEAAIVDLVTGGLALPADGVMVSNVRHKNLLFKALEHLTEAQEAVGTGLTPELVAVDLRAAWETVGEINGRAVTEDIVDKIFADFCIGK
ncbi:MAG: tRNA uridine-5-carboxymethylaminomethyl(34) synthesis GTPase MnmE [Firmicutes bacterium]|nr:tRNA uridine-5-carboxymethylaminomethyl(34) synthesis GTPase MnmE [Bacillota bacterium]